MLLKIALYMCVAFMAFICSLALYVARLLIVKYFIKDASYWTKTCSHSIEIKLCNITQTLKMLKNQQMLNAITTADFISKRSVTLTNHAFCKLVSFTLFTLYTQNILVLGVNFDFVLSNHLRCFVLFFY